jgi:uncharacterized protein YdeI (YjbR/CyaY-like superfamily)
MIISNPQVDAYFHTVERWYNELAKLRAILLDCLLTEELKWHSPVYTWQKKNIAAINGLKESCALSFFKGVLLTDKHNILLTPGNHTQAGRWVKFTSVQDIEALEPVLKSYIFEAIEAEKAGLKVVLKKKRKNLPFARNFSIN